MTDIFLWIDDERTMPVTYTHWAKTSQEAIDILSSLSPEDALVLVSFDHDLSYPQDDGHSKAEPIVVEYDDVRRVVKWMQKEQVYPELAIVHSQNPIGAKWVQDELMPFVRVIRRPYNPKDYS